MAQPHKGPRRGFLVRWTDEDGRRAKAQAAAAGMSINDYLTQLVRRDLLDQEGRPADALGGPAPDRGSVSRLTRTDPFSYPGRGA